VLCECYLRSSMPPIAPCISIIRHALIRERIIETLKLDCEAVIYLVLGQLLETRIVILIPHWCPFFSSSCCGSSDTVQQKRKAQREGKNTKCHSWRLYAYSIVILYTLRS